MAQKPSKASGSKISNIIDLFRGNFDFNLKGVETSKPVAYGSSELISTEERSKLLSGALRSVDQPRTQLTSAGSLLGVVQSSLTKIGHERLENRKILQLMPEVDKAARLMIASIFSPNDLSRQEISVIVAADGVNDEYQDKLSKKITTFFQDKLDLKTQAPSWVYQFGYETGSCVFAIIPMRSFAKIEDSSYVGSESFLQNVINPLCSEVFFGFGDVGPKSAALNTHTAALESLCSNLIVDVEVEDKKSSFTDSARANISKKLVEKMIAQESLSLTDNPSILQVNHQAQKKRNDRSKNVLDRRYKTPKTEPILSISADRDPKEGLMGNPILMRLPPEAVTVIHTPSDPSDHQGYLVLLDHTGNPITALMQENTNGGTISTNGSGQENIFSQTYNAYGLSNGFRGSSNRDTMSHIYNQVVAEHLKKRLDKAGFTQVELSNMDSVFRCMFGRFMQQKQTRILFLPKDLVTYMTFEMDQNGYGVSRLDRVKFNLGMKMAIQVSRVLAGIKAAMDRRKVEINFTDNMMENPESVFQSITREYVNKQTMSFSIDPNIVQSQIADKSLSIKGNNIPGMETFELTNEPDNRTSSVDFDSGVLEYLDKSIYNGLHVPPATMNSLGEDEYARSVTTTNLFFSMDVAIDQDIVIKLITDLLRKYARYSEDFQNLLIELSPNLDPSKTKKSKPGKSSTDETQLDLKTKSAGSEGDSEETSGIPDDVSIEDIIDAMSISLPKPNVAPSKAQFESLDAMITSITNMMNSLFPDELAGSDDALRPVVTMLRAKFTATNIRAYLAGSGMAGLDVPDTSFGKELKDLGNLSDALQNVAAMLKDKTKIANPVDPAGSVDTGIPGY